jgi:serine/threonine-protein kinase
MKDYAKVLDFGLAKVTEREMRPGSVILTQEGMVFGTPEFMSPEQAQGKVLTPGSDIYSLAVILYEVLTGKLPFEAKTAMEYIQAHVNTPPIPIDERAGKKFPPLLWQTISRALSKDSEARFKTAADFATAMKAVLAGETVMPATLAPPPPPSPLPPEVATPVIGQGKVKRAPTPAAASSRGGARTPMDTKPDRPKSAMDKVRGEPSRGAPIGLLVGVAAACLILGVLITVVAMKVFVH